MIRNITPAEFNCSIGACPAIYSVENVTNPKGYCAPLPSCPKVYKQLKNYLVIGTSVSQEEAGLEKLVGEGQAVIEVPKNLINKRNS